MLPCTIRLRHDLAAASDQRVVSISGREEAQAPISPAIEALMYCAAPVIQEEGDPQKCVRLVVPSSQVCAFIQSALVAIKQMQHVVNLHIHSTVGLRLCKQ